MPMGHHGAIFQLNRGRGQILKSELEAAGAQVTRPEDETTGAKHTRDQE